MKFLTFMIYDVAKTADIAAASDKVMSNLPPGIKIQSQYVCLGVPFPGVPPNNLVSVSIGEADTAESLAQVSYPLALAGATIYRVPILELPLAKTAEVERKYRG